MHWHHKHHNLSHNLKLTKLCVRAVWLLSAIWTPLELETTGLCRQWSLSVIWQARCPSRSELERTDATFPDLSQATVTESSARIPASAGFHCNYSPQWQNPYSTTEENFTTEINTCCFCWVQLRGDLKAMNVKLKHYVLWRWFPWRKYTCYHSAQEACVKSEMGCRLDVEQSLPVNNTCCLIHIVLHHVCFTFHQSTSDCKLMQRLKTVYFFWDFLFVCWLITNNYVKEHVHWHLVK